MPAVVAPRRRSRLAWSMMVRVALSVAACCLSRAASARGTVVYAGGAWAAIDRGSGVRGAVALADGSRQGQGPGDRRASAFTPDHRRWGEFHARLSRVPRAGSSVMLTSATSRSCWSRAAAGRGAAARCRSRRSSPRCATRRRCGSRRATAPGGASSDPYLLDGAPTAIDAAAARCALRGAGKIQ